MLRVLGSISGQGTKISQAVRAKKKKKGVLREDSGKGLVLQTLVTVTAKTPWDQGVKVKV